MHLRRLVSAAALCAALAASAGAQTATTATRNFSFPQAGLASSETAQVNVWNAAANSSSGTAASCAGSISFVNSSGATIGTATTFTVTSGQIFSASLPFSKSGATGLRTEVRAVVALTITSGSSAPCELVPTFETYDSATGATHIFLPGSAEFGRLPEGPQH